MKKFTFLLLAIFTVCVSYTTQAAPQEGYSEKSTADVQTFFNVQTTATTSIPQIKLKQTLEALNFHTARIQKELNTLAAGVTTPVFTVDATSSLVLLRNSNKNTITGVQGYVFIHALAAKDDIYVYNVKGGLKNVATGKKILVGDIPVVGSSNDIVYTTHSKYGKMTLFRVNANSLKYFSAQKAYPIGSVPATGNYVMELDSISYFTGDVLTSTSSLPKVALFPANKTNTVLIEVSAPSVENTSALCSDLKDNDNDGSIDLADSDCSRFVKMSAADGFSFKNFFKNVSAQVIYIFGK